MFRFALLAKIVARKVVKPILACFLNITCKQSEKMKYVAKKSSCIYPFFFSAKSEKFCCSKKEVYEANSFKPTCFSQSLSPSSCRMKLQSVVFRLFISTFFSENQSCIQQKVFATKIINKTKNIFLLFAEKEDSFCNKNLKRRLTKSSTKQQDYFTVTTVRSSSNQQQPFQQKHAKQILRSLTTFSETSNN